MSELPIAKTYAVDLRATDASTRHQSEKAGRGGTIGMEDVTPAKKKRGKGRTPLGPIVIDNRRDGVHFLAYPREERISHNRTTKQMECKR